MPSLNNYIDEFSQYISSGDTTALVPYLTKGANPAFLRIYRNGAIKACLDALAANFPSLNQYLGEDVFKQLGREYVLRHWPQDSCLSNYGEDLVDFIGSIASEYPVYSGDLAKLDRAWLDALFASDEPPLSVTDIASLVSEDETSGSQLVRLASTVRLIRLDQQCLQVWIGLKFAQKDPVEEQGSKLIMMWRHEQKVHYRQLDEFEESFINSISKFGSIMIAAESAITANPGRDISTLFAGLLTAGILAKAKQPIED